MNTIQSAIQHVHEQDLSGLLTLVVELPDGRVVNVTLSFLKGQWVAAQAGDMGGNAALALLLEAVALRKERWFAVANGLMAASQPLPDVAVWLDMARPMAVQGERRRQLDVLRDLMTKTLGIDGDAIVARCESAHSPADHWPELMGAIRQEIEPLVGAEQARLLTR
ncbi:MAG: hypothetical protein KF871_09625 [Hydrogenophaga sp.]|uniref:hypothetical protein n=1 Tax=Hydrogenophaga sp. TaxID=1904254 RepID=UPI001D5875EA|nr:hypothetical protein [Hydrogenophaga sp.]MBX3610144.1 hypothetical protein [Hydrogenophaga sp.]